MLGMSSSQLTNSYFQRGRSSTNQTWFFQILDLGRHGGELPWKPLWSLKPALKLYCSGDRWRSILPERSWTFQWNNHSIHLMKWTLDIWAGCSTKPWVHFTCFAYSILQVYIFRSIDDIHMCHFSLKTWLEAERIDRLWIQQDDLNANAEFIRMADSFIEAHRLALIAGAGWLSLKMENGIKWPNLQQESWGEWWSTRRF